MHETLFLTAQRLRFAVSNVVKAAIEQARASATR